MKMSCDLVSRAGQLVRRRLRGLGPSVTLSAARSAYPHSFQCTSTQFVTNFRCRSISTANIDDAVESRTTKSSVSRGTIQKWEEPFVAEVYRQLRGHHLAGNSLETASTEGVGVPLSSSTPGWNFSLEDERGLRFGSAYMLLTLAWNRKFTRLRDLLINANRTREGAKQALTRVVDAVSSLQRGLF